MNILTAPELLIRADMHLRNAYTPALRVMYFAKSCSEVSVYPAGAEAVTALKLAVFVPVKPVDILTNCFLT